MLCASRTQTHSRTLAVRVTLVVLSESKAVLSAPLGQSKQAGETLSRAASRRSRRLRSSLIGGVVQSRETCSKQTRKATPVSLENLDSVLRGPAACPRNNPGDVPQRLTGSDRRRAVRFDQQPILVDGLDQRRQAVQACVDRRRKAEEDILVPCQRQSDTIELGAHASAGRG